MEKLNEDDLRLIAELLRKHKAKCYENFLMTQKEDAKKIDGYSKIDKFNSEDYLSEFLRVDNLVKYIDNLIPTYRGRR